MIVGTEKIPSSAIDEMFAVLESSRRDWYSFISNHILKLKRKKKKLHDLKLEIR